MCKKALSSVPVSCYEVFSTPSGSAYQSDTERALYIEFAGKVACYDVRCLQRLKKAIFRIDLEAMATDTSRTDIEIITLCACEHCYVLTLKEILAFRELLEGTFVMLELNSIIQERLHTRPVYA